LPKADHNKKLYSFFIPPELSKRKMFRNSVRDHGKINFFVSVTTISSYSFEARGFKFGMKIYLINAVKLVGQIFKFLYGSRDN